MIFLSKPSSWVLRAGTLMYTVIISFLIAVLCASMMLYATLNRYANDLQHIAESNINNTFSLYNKALLDYDSLPYGNSKLLLGDFDGEVTKRKWGVYDFLMLEYSKNSDTLFEKGLIGVSNIQKQWAVYLGQANLPLTLAGNTVITGNIKVAKKGIKKGYLAGHPNKSLINGNVEKSEKELPALINTFDYFENISNEEYLISNIETNSLYYNEFSNKTKLLRCDMSRLETLNLKGNLVLSSRNFLDVWKNNILEDVIIVGDTVRIRKGFKGTLQIFGRKQIILEEDVELQYPSALYMNFSGQGQGEILMYKNSSISGAIVCKVSETHYQSNVVLKLKPDSKVNGLIYCQGNVELRGVVNGSVFTNGFSLESQGSYFNNYILNGVINRQNCPTYFLTPLVFQNLQYEKNVYWKIKKL